MTIGTCPLSWSLSDVKRTWLVAAHMSAFDPKRTFMSPFMYVAVIALKGTSGCDLAGPKSKPPLIAVRRYRNDAELNSISKFAWRLSS